MASATKDAAWAELSSPDCPAERWWELAEQFAMDIHRTPLFGLLTLENPGRWQELRRDRAYSWSAHYENYLWPGSKLAYMADCVDHVLWTIREYASLVTEATTRISTIRKFYANHDGRQVLYRMPFSRSDALQPDSVQHANTMRGVIENLRHEGFGCWYVKNNCAEAVSYRIRSDEWEEAPRGFKPKYDTFTQSNLRWKDEFVWQWDRMVHYLQQQESDKICPK